MLYYKKLPFFILSIFFSSLSFSQDNCIQQIESLGAPIKIDTLITIDPDTYEQQLQEVKRYIPAHQIHHNKIEGLSILDNTSDKEVSAQIKNQFLDNLNDFDAIASKNGLKVYYLKIGNCLKISKTEEIL